MKRRSLKVKLSNGFGAVLLIVLADGSGRARAAGSHRRSRPDDLDI